MDMGHTAFIGVGSNLGDRVANCEFAVTLLQQDGLTKLLIKSKWYETRALVRWCDSTLVPDYINGVVRIETELSPYELLAALQKIENRLGRVRTGKKWEPRTADLDILFYDDMVIDTPALKIPHPELHKRMFVLRPLCDIAPTFAHPVLNETMQELLLSLRANEVNEAIQVVREIASA